MPSVFASQPTGTPASLTMCSSGGSGHGPGGVMGDGSGTDAGAGGTPSQQSQQMWAPPGLAPSQQRAPCECPPAKVAQPH